MTTIAINGYLTWKCNFECAHCGHECGPKGNHMTELQLNYMFNFMDWLFTKNIPPAVIGITGGEPTLHPLFWPIVMPKLKTIKHTYNFSNIEMHTNASVPVPKLMYGHYTGFFSKIYVGHDIFHDEFKKLNELDAVGYTEISKALHYGNIGMSFDPMHGYIQCIRPKGRGARLDPDRFQIVQVYPHQTCFAREHGYGLNISFTPDHINFCGEKSHPKEGNTTGEGQFLPYTTSYEDLLAGAIKYNVLHAGKFCTQPCGAMWVKEKVLQVGVKPKVI